MVTVPKPSREGELFRFLCEFTQQNGYAPSIREMSAALGLQSVQAVHRYLDRLRKRGLVDWEPGKARTLRILVRPE